ncbi:MAG: hypothetical protein GDA51_04730 [Ekhidna sp.]|nr:hypothetical protein [Ekhidna sp.]
MNDQLPHSYSQKEVERCLTEKPAATVNQMLVSDTSHLLSMKLKSECFNGVEKSLPLDLIPQEF